MAILPNREQIKALLASEHDGPVIMLNLLRFSEGGRESYLRYADNMGGMVRERGGTMRFAGRSLTTVIGEDGESWDAVALIEYPSIKDFIEITSSPAYDKIKGDRESGLESQVLVALAERAAP
jgi:uncharacterized protein (DUF1330 family)